VAFNFYLKFVPLVILVQHYISTKLEVSTAFLFRENRRHGTYGQTDGAQRLMRLPREVCIKSRYRTRQRRQLIYDSQLGSQLGFSILNS